MWEAIGRMKLKNKVTGESLKKHLRRKGITELGECDYEKEPEDGTFEDHIRDVEDDFWNDRFPVYNKWKKKWYEAYIDRGWFDTLTGFRIEGIYKRNDVINYPPQGSAFHWLLWSLIRIQKLLHKYNMRSLIVGQIHDSIVADVFRKELRNFLEICKQVMTVDIKKHWDWIIVPLTVEAEVAPVNGNWYEKKEVKL
jgi:DNA polymerase I-like protein with 3'-5' exonuclease and polymerase domains